MQANIFEGEFDEEGFNNFFGANETPAETSEEQYEDLKLSDVMKWEVFEEGEEDNFLLN